MPVAESVHIPFHTRFICDDERVEANHAMERVADTMLDELLRIGTALRPLRARAARVACVHP